MEYWPKMSKNKGTTKSSTDVAMTSLLLNFEQSLKLLRFFTIIFELISLKPSA